jgi:hypothetical protein
VTNKHGGDNEGGDNDGADIRLLIAILTLITALVTYASSHH